MFRTRPVVASGLACHGDMEDVIVTVSIWMIALAVQFSILLSGQRVRMEPVRGSKTGKRA